MPLTKLRRPIFLIVFRKSSDRTTFKVNNRAIKDRDPAGARDAMRDHLVRAQKAQQLESVTRGGVSNN